MNGSVSGPSFAGATRSSQYHHAVWTVGTAWRSPCLCAMTIHKHEYAEDGYAGAADSRARAFALLQLQVLNPRAMCSSACPFRSTTSMLLQPVVTIPG